MLENSKENKLLYIIIYNKIFFVVYTEAERVKKTTVKL